MNKTDARIVEWPFLVCAALFIGAFVGMNSETSLNLALPLLSQTFGVLLAIALVFALRCSQDALPTERCKLDSASLIASLLGFGALVLAVGLLSLYEPTHPFIVASALIGICALIVYVNRQLHMSEPVLNMRTFANASFTLGALCMMLNFGITLSVMYMVPQYLQTSLGLDASVVGLLLLPGGIVNAVVSVVSGRMYDKLGAALPTIVGFGISICAALLFITTGTNASLMLVLAMQILCMIGVPLAMSPAQTYALAALIDYIRTHGDYESDNTVTPQVRINPYREEFINDLHESILFRMKVLGFDLDRRYGTPELNTSKLQIRRKNIDAYGKFDAQTGAFTVLAGSDICCDIPIIKNRAASEKRSELFGDSHQREKLQSDATFASPSTAAVFVLGGSKNGWTEWVDEVGTTLDQLYPRLTLSESNTELHEKCHAAGTTD